MSGGREAPVVVRLDGPRLAALIVAVAVLLGFATYAGFRLGRQALPSGADVRPSSEPDAPMIDQGGEAAGFETPVSLSSGYAVVYRRTASLDEARRARDEAAGRSLPVRIDQDPRRPREDRFHVLVGPFPDRAEAEAAARTLARDGAGDLDLVFVE